MTNEFGLGLETKKHNTTAWINKAKPYFVDQIGDTLQGDLDMNNFKVTNLKSPENDNDAVHKKYFREQINSIEELNALETKLNSELQKELTNIKQQIQNIDDSEIKTYIQQQIQNIDDSEIKTYIQQQIQNIDDSVIQQQITTINNLVLKQDKNKVALEKKYLKEGNKSYYFTLPFGRLSIRYASVTDNIDQLLKVKVETTFFRQNFRLSKKFNAQKVLQFINDRDKNVEYKEYESNNENNKVNHLYEIKTSGKYYIDRFRMLIVPDNEEDDLSLSEFNMIFETESLIENPKPQKELTSPSYDFL
ncbi:hypothetical protein LOTGIDRAFT_157238 [Lottia gigantea]|uniref:Uncharacterized protein n=1 Tax=Lottia gigantea TaxID=225164 RepID=V4AX15_LOTGI|nr:hypothetical protein LOTGIDRAFT_157238 [Lottia gigantea]ESP02088.1 hypothetical protein LOTGIDRAFT_157238 [Lottia gigantea]